MDAPWIVAIHYDGGDRNDYFTGVGMVIAPEWVLTCAHLFSSALDRPETGEPSTDEKAFHLRIGDPRLLAGTRHEIAERVENDFAIAAGTPEARKNLTKPCADIALLRLTEPTDVPPARLLAGQIVENTPVSCLGWPGGSRGSGLLTQINTYIITRDAGRGGMIKDDEFCAANAAQPASMAKGYSGGPAVILADADSSLPSGVVGVLSRGASVGFADTLTDPAIIGDLTAHREFIEKVTGIQFLEPAQPQTPAI